MRRSCRFFQAMLVVLLAIAACSLPAFAEEIHRADDFYRPFLGDSSITTIVDTIWVNAYENELSKLESADKPVLIGGMHDQNEDKRAFFATADVVLEGLHNTYYTHIGDLPITRFVMGKVTSNLAEITALQQRVLTLYDSRENATNTEETRAKAQRAVEQSQQLDGLLNGTVKQSFRVLWGTVALLLLILMFMIQMTNVAYTHFVSPQAVSRIFIPGIVFRFVIFMIAILFYPTIVAGCIDISNYCGMAFVSLQEQTMMNDFITQNLVAYHAADGSSIKTVLDYCFRMLAYASLKILFIMRDVLLAMTVAVGPICIAIGSFHNYASQGNDPIRGYLSGWIEGFVKILLWGPISGIMLAAIFITTLLNMSGSVDVLTVAVIGIATLYAAARVPDLASDLSGLVLQSLFMKVGAGIAGSVALAGAGTALAVGGASSLAAGAVGQRAATSAAVEAARKFRIQAPRPGRPGGKGRPSPSEKGAKPWEDAGLAARQAYNRETRNAMEDAAKKAQHPAERVGAAASGIGKAVSSSINEQGRNLQEKTAQPEADSNDFRPRVDIKKPS